MSTQEQELLLRLRSGDEDAFGVLYDLHARTVHRYAWALVHDRDAAADVVQETFLVAWRRRRAIRLASASLLPWLLTTARFVAMNELRRQRRHPVDPLVDDAGFIAPTDDGVESRLELEAVMRSIDRLEKLDQAIIRLCLFEDRTYDEAARQLNITPTAVGKRMERARKRLRTLHPDNTQTTES